MTLPTQNCPGIAQVNMVMSDDGQVIENVYHVSNGALRAFTDPELESIRSIFQTFWNSHQKLIEPDTLSLQEIIVTDLTSLLGHRIVELIEGGSPGTAVGAQLPLNVTKAFELFTGSRGRGVNGKVYWPALLEDQVTGDALSSVALAAIEAALNWLVAEIPATMPGFALTVLSRYLDKVRRPTGIGRNVTDVTVPNPYVDSQKDRLPGHRKHKRRIIA